MTDRDGTEVYHCPDYTKEGSENTYPQVLFKNDPPARMATVNIHFPTLNSYIFSSVKFYDPVTDLHICIACDVHFYYLYHLPSEEVDRDKE